MDTIGISFIDSGFAAELHALALSKIRGRKCEILAVCSKTKESAQAFANKLSNVLSAHETVEVIYCLRLG